jgi:hypothetical protein
LSFSTKKIIEFSKCLLNQKRKASPFTAKLYFLEDGRVRT